MGGETRRGSSCTARIASPGASAAAAPEPGARGGPQGHHGQLREFIETEMVAVVPEQVLAKLLMGVPVGRLGQASELARAVQFLVDDDAATSPGA